MYEYISKSLHFAYLNLIVKLQVNESELIMLNKLLSEKFKLKMLMNIFMYLVY